MTPMKTLNSLTMRKRERGQTIIIAMVVLGILLILGIVFLGIIDKNGKTAYNLGNRSAANDLSEAGIRYAHAQLLTSQLGADWRGTPTNLGTSNSTLDPDIYYLRPAGTLSGGGNLSVVPGGSQIDLGGPDGLGPYFRVQYASGRSLVRVRYAPSDANIFSNSPVGPLRHPGLARNYIIIESVGREGLVNQNDPTTLNSGSPIQYQNFLSDLDFRVALGQMQQTEAKYPFSQVNRAFVSIGIIESARFISNKYNVTRAADIGIPAELGALYGGAQVSTNLKYQLGSAQPLYNLGAIPTPAGNIEQGGSIFSNASVSIHGNVVLDINRYLGDQFDVAGSVGAASGGQLTIALRDLVTTGGQYGPTWATVNNVPAVLNSQDPTFSTILGTYRDGSATPDAAGNPRGVGAKGTPSIETTDPNTGENRYVLMTADSGLEASNGNDGLFGHGAGVYVSNPSDIQGPVDEAGRQNVGSEQSLLFDWLNPNSGMKNSGWLGYLYIPPGAVFIGKDDGFIIQRMPVQNVTPVAEKNWRYIDGSDTGSSTSRYRIGIGSDGLRHIVNSFTPVNRNTPSVVININGSLAATDYDKGPVFNGVVYFEGNARVQGIIPTDVQLTLVSNATIYIDNSITKGVTANGLQASSEGFTPGQIITRPSKSMLMLMAKDYVTLNTTMFVGPAPSQTVVPFADTPNSNGFNPLWMLSNDPSASSVNGEFAMDFSFVRDPSGPNATPNNPSTTRPYEYDYAEVGSPAIKIPTSVLVAHTMADGPAQASFISWDLNQGGGAPSTYMFSSTNNTVSNYIPGVSATIAEYGIGNEPYQRYSKFEQTSFPLIDSTTATVSPDGQNIIANGPTGHYSLFTEGTNELLVRPAPVGGVPMNDYFLGRMALAPHDIRIEASIYAEEGSFFVIPGPWFNPNPGDTRTAYANGGASQAERDLTRLENYGASNTMPFYGEPLDVRIVIYGAISENMPPPASVQAQWLQKWGWIPGDFAATGLAIPGSHVPSGYTVTPGTSSIVPNLVVTYDPALSTGRSTGFVTDNNTTTLLRTDSYGRPLPPMPRLPVSPVLAYFGEVH